MQNKWRIAETLYASKTPVMEAEYAFDESTALSLYDSLIPMLKEHRRLVVKRDFYDLHEDY